jgi:ketosteroid isomerase-like protein
MSRENIAKHRRFVEAFNARDIEGMLAYCDPGIEFHSAFAAVGGAVYHGHAGMRRWHSEFEDVWSDDVHVEVEDWFDLDDRVLSYYVVYGRGRNSGAEVEMPNAMVARWRNGLMVHFRVYAHREDASAGLGLSQDEIERARLPE